MATAKKVSTITSVALTLTLSEAEHLRALLGGISDNTQERAVGRIYKALLDAEVAIAKVHYDHSRGVPVLQDIEL